jgi:hypothetical protein
VNPDASKPRPSEYGAGPPLMVRIKVPGGWPILAFFARVGGNAACAI